VYLFLDQELIPYRASSCCFLLDEMMPMLREVWYFQRVDQIRLCCLKSDLHENLSFSCIINIILCIIYLYLNKSGSKYFSLLLVTRYELKRSEYVTKLPKGKHSTKGNMALELTRVYSIHSQHLSGPGKTRGILCDPIAWMNADWFRLDFTELLRGSLWLLIYVLPLHL